MTEQTPKLVGERIGRFFAMHQTNSNHVSTKLGNLTQQIIMSYIQGDRFPSFKFLYGLKNLYPDLSLDWILLGEGEMHTSININKGAFSGSSNSECQIAVGDSSADKARIAALERENEDLRNNVSWLKNMLEMTVKKG